MHTKRFHTFLWLAILIVGLSACNLPFLPPAPTPFLTPTPNLTMTALFAPTEITTPTPAPVITSTPFPTLTPTETPRQASPTPTSTPTKSLPTATPEREGGVFEATYLGTPPTIDGTWDEWNTKAYPARNVTFGVGEWDGAEDLEASFRIGWDEDNLYLAVKVKDDRYVQNATGEDIFKGDSLELLLDVDLVGDYLTTSLNDDDYQLGISPGRPDVGHNLEAYLWFPRAKAGAQDQVQIAAVQGKGVYRVEAAIPWSIFGVTPSAGQRFGFVISASDNDKAGENVQQSLTSSAAGRSLLDPTTWGELELKR